MISDKLLSLFLEVVFSNELAEVVHLFDVLIFDAERLLLIVVRHYLVESLLVNHVLPLLVH